MSNTVLDYLKIRILNSVRIRADNVSLRIRRSVNCAENIL
jgi:hypothetical protein